MNNEKGQPAGRQGFTIVELLLYMSLLTVFIIVMVEIFVTIMKIQIRSETLSSAELDSRFIMQRMSYDFTNSTNLDTTIATYSVDSNGKLKLGSDFLSGLDTTISNLSFTKIGNSVQVKFTMDNQDYQSTFALR